MKTVAGGNVYEAENYRQPIVGTPVGHPDLYHPRHPKGIRVGSKFFTPTGVLSVVGSDVVRFLVVMVLGDGQRLSRHQLIERVIHAGWDHVPPTGNLAEFWNEI